MKKILVLGVVAIVLASAMVLVSCSACPGGGTSGSKGGCEGKFSSDSTSSYKECSNACIYNQVINDSSADGKSFKCDC